MRRAPTADHVAQDASAAVGENDDEEADEKGKAVTRQRGGDVTNDSRNLVWFAAFVLNIIASGVIVWLIVVAMFAGGLPGVQAAIAAIAGLAAPGSAIAALWLHRPRRPTVAVSEPS